MGTIEITTEPHQLIIDGTTILMQADPTAGKAWDDLLEVKVVFKPETKRRQSLAALTDALAALTHSPEDAETLRKLELGLPTLQDAAKGYVRVVTGFPTMPSAGLKRS